MYSFFFFCSLSSVLLSISTDQEKMMASLFSLDLIENVCLVPNYSTVVETCSSLNILHIFPAIQGKIQEKKGVWILGIRFLHSTFYIRKDWNQIKRKFPPIGSRGARYVGLQMFIIVSAFCRSEIFFFYIYIYFRLKRISCTQNQTRLPSYFQPKTYKIELGHTSKMNNLDKMNDRKLNCNFSYAMSILNFTSKPHLQI